MKLKLNKVKKWKLIYLKILEVRKKIQKQKNRKKVPPNQIVYPPLNKETMKDQDLVQKVNPKMILRSIKIVFQKISLNIK
mmetsp:Transcript_28510/g.43869  ORF Transcript_28510/g.43869 Transcript_28510/m.43869 type:complete len:80 (-) Transcript_28510:59-298(-)